MSSGVFKSRIEQVILYKFTKGTLAVDSASKSINILPQVKEISIFESIFSPVIRAELVVIDSIGLFVNFPFSGEELISISFHTYDGKIRSELMVVESVTDISVTDDNRSSIYTLRAISLEAWQNARITVQKAFNGQSSDAVKAIYDQYITTPLSQIFPEYHSRIKPLFVTGTDEQKSLLIIPNLKPFAAINMVAEYAQPISDTSYTYMFYQTTDGYYYKTLQSMFQDTTKGGPRSTALLNKYRYKSDDIENPNETDPAKIVTSLNYNRRHSTLDKISKGYFQNKFFEINIAQKAFYITETKTANVSPSIESNKLNTKSYMDLVPLDNGDEPANLVEYYINNQKEMDVSFPVSEKRARRGKDLISLIAMSQVDLTATVQGDTALSVGGLIYLEIPESHGFSLNKDDDLISGLFLITEKRDTVDAQGTYTTSLRLQKDSYHTSIDRDNRLRYDD